MKSQNDEPYKLTLDIFFDDKKKYEKSKKADVITKELIAKLYDIPLNNVEGIFYVQIPKLPARMLH